MAGRRVFFSFHYEEDVWRATIVRNATKVDAASAAAWNDASMWEEAKRKGQAELQRKIDAALRGTSVTAVLIGAETAERRWVKYEIERSVAKGNGLLGVRIDRLKDESGQRGQRGAVPDPLAEYGARIYDWKRSDFGHWVEVAAMAAGKPCLKHGRQNCFSCRWFW